MVKGEAFPSFQRKKSKGTQNGLTSESAPDNPPPLIGHLEIDGRSPSEKLQGQGCLADVRYGKDERHRLANTGAGRCLERQLELSRLRLRLNG
jgi:hypothetical protein